MKVKHFAVAHIGDQKVKGLYDVVLVAQDGQSWNVAVEGQNRPKLNDLVKAWVDAPNDRILQLINLSFQLEPERLLDAAPEVVNLYWKCQSCSSTTKVRVFTDDLIEKSGVFCEDCLQSAFYQPRIPYEKL